MKKKIFAVITVVLLVAVLCLSLVACGDNKNNDKNDDKDNTPVELTFSEDMSKAEIIEQLGKIENLTLEAYNTGKKHATYYVGKTFYWCEYAARGNSSFEFLDGNRSYYGEYYPDGSGSYLGMMDYTGYDADLLPYFERRLQKEYIDKYIGYVNNDEYFIENGKFKHEESKNIDGITQTVVLTVYDCNVTKVPSMPEHFGDYKTMPATGNVVDFGLSDDGAYYCVDFIDQYVRSYEVPSTYNGKPVKGFIAGCYSENLKTITLPTSIVKLGYCGHNADDGELLVIYKGTRAQWSAIEDYKLWSNTNGVRITCTDGEFYGF